MSTNRTANDEARTPERPTEGGINPGVAIIGFLICFVAGAGLMWGVDARLPHGSAGITADTAGAVSKKVSAGAVHVDLHVMAQCPYGVQAEAAFKDVVSKLGSDVDLNVEYIGQSQGGEPSSMHGPNEVKGDLYQVCAKKYAPEKAFDFILCQNENSKEMGSNGAACATKVGAPAPKITACAEGQEGKDLLLASFKRSQDKGVSGSPTVFIAGKKYASRPTSSRRSATAPTRSPRPAPASRSPPRSTSRS
jgi:Gamma interferon inducible lysosomal thiol reductase (GILT)